ncbi:MAG: F0F1 ATP synthase subunit A [Bacilli bacterium]|nr:F0F1 ATP synthase subunit A [Bacilli bacterium]
MRLFPLFLSDPLGDMIASFGDPTFRISGPLLSSLAVMLIVAVLAIIVGIQARRHDPMKPSKGLLALAEGFVAWLQDWTRQIMGRDPGNWPGYFLALFSYLFLAFIWSITGFPSVIDTLVMPLALSLVMFVLIQFTALRYKKWGYFHRYIEPVPLFLPINLVTMWTPIISTTLRMFGNCIAGSVVIGLLNWATKNLSVSVFSAWAESYASSGASMLNSLDTPAAIVFGPVIIGILNLYFALFSGYIQTLVFASLNGVWIGAEMPEDRAMGLSSQATRSMESKLS